MIRKPNETLSQCRARYEKELAKKRATAKKANEKEALKAQKMAANK